MAVARPVLERDAPLPAAPVRERLRIGPGRADSLARHRDRAIAGEPVRPVLEAGFQRTFDQQRAEARAINEKLALYRRAIFQHDRLDMAALAVPSYFRSEEHKSELQSLMRISY